MLEKKCMELTDDSLDKATSGKDEEEWNGNCDWNGVTKYKIELNHAYVRNNVSFCVYVPLAHVSGPTGVVEWVGGKSFHVFSCKHYEYGTYQNTHDVSFGENDIITEVTDNYN